MVKGLINNLHKAPETTIIPQRSLDPAVIANISERTGKLT